MSKSTGRRSVGSSSKVINRRLRAAVVATPAIAALMAMAPHAAHAVDLYWDINGTTAGATDAVNGTATGTWDSATTANWSTDSTGASATATWINDGTSTAVFSAGANATGGYTVTVPLGDTLNVNGMRFEEGGVTIAPAAGTSPAPTFNLSGQVNVFSGGTAVMNVVASGAWEKTGNGTLSLGAKPTGAVTVTAGQLFTSAALMPDVVINNSTGTGTASGVGFAAIAGATAYAGVISGTGTITTAGASGAAGLNVFSFTANNTFTGDLRARNMGVTLSGGGAFSGAANLDLRQTRLTLAAGNTNRLGNTTNVSLRGSDFVMNGDETMGNVSVSAGGMNFVTLNAAGTLTANSFVRNNGGAMLLRGTGIGTTVKLALTTPPTITGIGTTGATVIPGIVAEDAVTGTGTDATLATYEAATGVRQLAAAEYATALTANTNFAPGAAATVAANTAINSVEFGGAGNVAATAGRAITLNSARTLTVTSGAILSNATSASSFGGAGTLSTGTSELVAHTVGTTGTINITAALTTGGIVKTGSGILSITGATTNTGGTSVNQGILAVNNPATLGSSVVLGHYGRMDAQTTGLWGGQLQLTGNNTYTQPLSMQGTYVAGTPAVNSQGALNAISGTNTWSGDITLQGFEANTGNPQYPTITAQAGATLFITGDIKNGLNADGSSVNGAIFTYGRGDVVLSGDSPNTYTNLMRPLGGRLILEKDGALGPATATNDILGLLMTGASSRATVAFRAPASSPGGFTYNTFEWIGLNGFGNDDIGTQLENLGGNNTFAGGVAWGGDLAGNLTRVNIVGGSSLNLSGPQAGRSAAARTITKVGTGELIISGDNSGTPAAFSAIGAGSTFNINAGSLTLRSANAAGGILPPGFTIINIATSVEGSGTLSLDNSLAVNTNRIASGVAVNMVGGELKLVGNAATTVAQPAPSQLNVGSSSTFTVVQPTTTNASTTTLNLGTINRTARGTALLRGMDNSSTFIGLGTTPGTDLKGGGGGDGSPTINILPYVIGDNSATGAGSDFVTITGAGNARTLTAGEYTPLVNGNATVVNTTVTANTGISTDTTVNSIKMNGGNTVTIDPGRKLFVKSGAMLGVGGGASTITGGTLTFEDATITTDPDTGETSINVISVAEGIITVPTGSSLAIASVLAGAEGITKSGQGTLTLSGVNTYGQRPTGKTTINAGVLEFSVDANLGDVGAEVVLNGGTLRPLATSASTRGIELASTGLNAIDVAGGNTFSTSGQVVGNALTKKGAGRLDLTNTSNSYTGGTIIEAGSMGLLAGSPTQPQLGTGLITLAGGSIIAESNMVLDRSLTSTSSNTTGGFIIPVGVTVQYGSGAASTVGMSGPGNYAINGGGTLRLSNNAGAAMTYTGSLIVNDGSTLVFHANDSATPNAIAGIGGTPVNTAEWVVLNNGSRLRFEITSNAGSNFSSSVRGITVHGGGKIDIAGTNHLINTTGIFGDGTVTKEGTGLYSLRTNNASFNGKWAVEAGTLEFGAPTNNGLSLGTGSGADFITLANGTTLQGTTTSSNSTILPGQGITLLGATAKIGSKTAVPLDIQGAITGPAVTNLTFGGPGHLPADNLTGVVTLSNPANNWTGTTTVAGGTLRVPAGGSFPTGGNIINNATLQVYKNGAVVGGISGSGSTTIGDGAVGVAAEAKHVRQAGGLTVAAGGSTLKMTADMQTGGVSSVGPLSIAADARVDLNSNKLMTTTSAGSFNGTVYTGVQGEVQRAYDFGAWDLPGLMTTQPNATAGITTIGIATAEQVAFLAPTETGVVFGQTVTGATTIAMYTYAGDLNFDGIVDASDYGVIDNFVQFPGTDGYANGDFNYDGIIDAGDYGIIDNTIQVQGAPIPGINDPFASAASPGGDLGGGLAGVTAVPEPASLSVVALGALSILGRRRRK